MIKYHYALDENGNFINIDLITKENKSEHSYSCPGSGLPMCPRLGAKNRHHFAHLDKTEHEGAEESYIHEIGKKYFKDWFYDSSKELFFQFHRMVPCSLKEQCCFFSKRICESLENFTRTNIRNYYDTCEIEKTIYAAQIDGNFRFSYKMEEGLDKYRADILLSHSEHPNRKPLLIEIYYKHPVPDNKIESGLKIIQIKVNSDEDIENLVGQTLIETNLDENPKISIDFYNMQEPETYHCPNLETVSRFVLYKSGKSFITPYVQCKDKLNIYNEKSFLELNINEHWRQHAFIYGYIYAMGLGINIKTCALCQSFSSERNICTLHNHLNTPRTPDPSFAINCSYYVLSDVKIADAQKEMEYKGILIEEVRKSIPLSAK